MDSVAARNDLLDAAVRYASLGWEVFPLAARSKVPKKGSRGLWDATSDPEQVRAWWTADPNANIGIATAGLIVIDVDSLDSWRELRAELGLNDDTVTCETPTGGLHVYYRANGTPIGCSVGKLGPGLDVRAEGGYVVAPPSIHPNGGTYNWAMEYSPDECELLPLPKALADRLTEQRRQPIAVAGTIPQGRRNDTLTSLAGTMRRRGMSPEAIEAALLAENNRCDPPLPESEVRAIAGSIARYEPQGDDEPDPPGRDYGHAQALAALWRDRYRWAAHRGVWMVWTGRRWEPVTEQQTAANATAALREHYGAALASASSKDEVKRLAALATETCAYARIQGALSFLKGFEGFHTDAEQWDADPWLLNVANGAVDLRTGELRPHDPADLCTRLAPVDYDATAEAPTWEAHLGYFLPDADVRRQVQRDLGLSLVGAGLEERLPIWYGLGANGKSTTARTVQAVLGDYATMAAPNLLVARRNEQHPTEIADLVGRRCVFSSELSNGARLDEAKVKQLTGGDRQKGRYMRCDFFEFDQSWTITLFCNHKPTITGIDSGIWRRVRLVPWMVEMPKEKQVPQEEMVDRLLAEGAGILRWLLAGLADWQREPHWMAEAVRAATDDYRAEQDRLAGFLADCCELGPHYTVAVGELFEAYTGWCEDAGEEALGKRAFGERLRDRGATQRRGEKGLHLWVGVRIKHQVTLGDKTSGSSGNQTSFRGEPEHMSPNVTQADVHTLEDVQVAEGGRAAGSSGNQSSFRNEPEHLPPNATCDGEESVQVHTLEDAPTERILQALRNAPHSAEYLAANLHMDRAIVDGALDVLEDAGEIVRQGDKVKIYAEEEGQNGHHQRTDALRRRLGGADSCPY